MLTRFENGWVYRTPERRFVKGNLLVRDGIIERFTEGGRTDDPAVFDCRVIDCAGKYLLPGLVDVHTHGRAGYDFNTADAEGVRRMREAYAKAGTTTVMATLASATMDSFRASADALRENRMPSPGLAHIAGIHLEGRYLNPKRRGAHSGELLAPLDPDELEALLNDFSPFPVHVSAAIEQEGGEEFVKRAVKLGATVGMAHSDATYEEAMQAVDWGVTSFTHTFNAMRAVHHREPGNAIASVLCDSAYTELICDGEHIHPAMIELASRLKPADKLVLITDSMEATGMPDGEYRIAGVPVHVRGGKAVNDDGALAGSTLDLFHGLTNYMKFTGKSLEEALPCATENPAKMVGIDMICGSLEVGHRADILFIDEKTKPEIEAVYVDGEMI